MTTSPFAELRSFAHRRDLKFWDKRDILILCDLARLETPDYYDHVIKPYLMSFHYKFRDMWVTAHHDRDARRLHQTYPFFSIHAHFETLHITDITDITDTSWMRSTTLLHLDSTQGAFQESSLKYLATSPHTQRIEQIFLGTRHIPSTYIEMLAQGLPGLRRFKNLKFIADEHTLTALQRAPFWPHLTELNLHNCYVHDELAQMLAQDHSLSSLKSLTLSGNPLTQKGRDAIRGASWFPNLEYSDLGEQSGIKLDGF